jgi:A/G-specific adenine glycosylase
MDLGATVCTRSRPACASCPLADDCVAYREGRTGELPAARPRKALSEREIGILILVHDAKVLVEQRPPSGIWGGLLSLPEIALGSDPAIEAERRGCRLLSQTPLPPATHTFTHFRLRMQPTICRVETIAANDRNDRWLDLAELDSAPLPAPVRRLLRKLSE